MATATKQRTRVAKVAPADFLRIEKFLCTEVLIERDAEMRVLIRGSIAGVNVHMGGGGGLAKSLALREYARCIEGARFFEKALQPGTPPDAVIGPYDMEKFARTGAFERSLEHYLPGAHIGFVDELLRSSGLMKDALMPLLNSEERRAEGNGGMVETDIRFLVTAANTWFEPDDPYTQAIEDRMTILMHVEDLKADDSFKELLRRDHARRQATRKGTLKRETMTLAQFEQAQIASEAVELSPEFLEAVADLRRKVREINLTVSPRRWVELVRVCRANAWLAGREHLVPEDLLSVEGGLWRSEDQIPNVRELLMEFRGKFERMAEERRAEADDMFARFEALRPKIEGVPEGEDADADVIKESVHVGRSLAQLTRRVQANIDEATNEHRDAGELHALANELDGVRKWFTKADLPINFKD